MKKFNEFSKNEALGRSTRKYTEVSPLEEGPTKTNVKKYVAGVKKGNPPAPIKISKEHYQIGQVLMLHDLPRKKGKGEEILVNGPSEIIGIDKQGDDIRYTVLMNMEMDHESPYGEKWKENSVRWTVLHNEDEPYYTTI